MGDPAFDDLVARLARAPRDERRILERILGRLELGRDKYGPLDLSKPRDWRRERFEERLDALVYDVAEELALEDAALAQAAAAEWRGEQPTVISEAPARLALDDLRDAEPYDGFDLSDIQGKG